MENQPEPQSPSPASRLLGALAGAFVGFFLGIILNVVVYNVTNQAVSIGWANSMWGGVIIGAVLGFAFPAVAQGIAWIFSLFLPL